VFHFVQAERKLYCFDFSHNLVASIPLKISEEILGRRIPNHLVKTKKGNHTRSGEHSTTTFVFPWISEQLLLA